MADEQPAHTTGGVPHAFRNAIFWRWAPDMPRPLRGGFLTLLYALGTAASISGRLAFRDGAGIRIQDIAQAVGSNEKDTRRYINAAIAAGVVTVDGDRRRGRATVYVLVVNPQPDWSAASLVLQASRPTRKDATPPPWREEDPEQQPADAPSSGDRHPNQFGRPTPELPAGNTESGSGDRHPNGFGRPTPDRFGSPTPEQPRNNQVLPQEMAGLGGQPQVARARAAEEDIPEDDPTDTAPELRPIPTPPVGRRARKAAASIQPPLLMSVPNEFAELRSAAEAQPGLVREAVQQLGHREAVRVYGRHLVWKHAEDLIDRTGT